MAFEDHFSGPISGLQGQPWSNFRNKLDDLLKDFSDDEDSETSLRLKNTRCGKLDKADAAIYGVCPELEELVVVNCRICSKIVKAEAIESHYESSHSEALQLVIKAVEDKRISTADLKPLQETLSTFTAKLVSTVKPVKQSPSSKSSSLKPPVSKSKTKPKKAAPVLSIASTSIPELPPTLPPLLKNNSPIHNKFIPSVPSPPLIQKNTVVIEAEKPKLEPVVSLVKVEVKESGTESDTPLSPPQLTPQVIVPTPVTPLITSPSILKTSSKSKSLRNRVLNNNDNISNNNNNFNTVNNNVSSNVNNNSSGTTVVAPIAPELTELDLDKHCGVIVDGVACSQSLSCKLHTLAMKQNVKGRSRKLEVFLADHVLEKEAAKKKKENKVVKATPDSTTSIPAPPPPVKTETVQQPPVETTKKLPPLASVPPTVSPAPLIASPVSIVSHFIKVPARKEDMEEKSKKTSSVTTVCTTSTMIQEPIPVERGPTPFFKACFLKHFEDLPKCYWPHRYSRTMDSMVPPRCHPFMICYSLMHRTKRGIKSIRYYAKNYPPVSLQSKKCANPFTSISRLISKDIKPINSNHVRPLAMCNFNHQKCGGLLYSNRQVQLARMGLQNILLKTSSTNGLSSSASSTISYMLNNMSSKASLVSRSPTNKKLAARQIPATNSLLQKSSFSAQLSNSPASLVKVTNFKSVLSQNSQKLAVKNIKNKQFHVPNILSNKRQSENSSKSNSKKAKKKLPARSSATSDMNASQMINDFLSKNSSLKQRKNDANVPVLRFAIANGRVEATGSSSGDQKTVYSTNLINDMKKIKMEPAVSSELPAVSIPNVPVQQTSTSNNFGSQQITYLTASPVTFQQISLRMLNQLQLQGKSQNGPSNGTVKIVANPSGGTLVKVPQSLIFQDKSSSV